jgi:hypothetical protein
MDFWGRFVLALLATWRVTHLLASEDGPADLMVRLRVRLGSSLAGQLMDCFNCLSMWVAAPAALFIERSFVEWLFGWLALSGGVCLLERLGREPVVFEPAPRSLEGDPNHVLQSESVNVPEQSDASSTTAHGASH